MTDLLNTIRSTIFHEGGNVQDGITTPLKPTSRECINLINQEIMKGRVRKKTL